MRRSPLVVPFCLCCSIAAARAQPPATPVRPVVDTLHGTPLTDPYRWLEDGTAAEVRAWLGAQAAYARATLDTLPGRAALLARVRSIGAAAPPEVSLPWEAAGRWFSTVRRPGDPVARGYVREGWAGADRLLVDPAAIASDGGAGAHTLTSFRPSPDGRFVLYGVAAGGAEAAVLRVRDVATGRDVGAPIERNRFDVNTWLPDSRAFLYLQLRAPAAGSPPTALLRDIRVLRHRIGDDAASDVAVISAASVGLDSTLSPAVEVDAASGVAIARLSSRVESHAAFFAAPLTDVAHGTPAWRPLFGLGDSVLAVAAHGPDLYVLTRKGAPRGRVVRTPLAAPDLARAAVVLPEGKRSLEAMYVALDGVYVRAFAAGATGLHRIPWGGRPAPVPLPRGTSVSYDDGVRAQPSRRGVLLTLDSWTSVGLAYRYAPARGALERLSLRRLGPANRLEGYVAETVLVPSHDGVRVPMTIVRPERMVRNGTRRVFLAAYGAYGRTDPPSFPAEFRPWYDAGGVTAVCHVRGSGYYGASWHAAGQKATKPNSWRDFIACAEYLVRAGYTRPERLVATGASAGGITVGRAITERPDLFAAAVIAVGLLDAVRFETTPGGPANVREFGSVATLEGFRALLAMSAVHHVRPGTSYPAVLLTAGLNDPRLPPWEPGKMAAALQAATTSRQPVLLRVDEAAGHGAASTDDDLHRYVADVLAFALAATELAARPAAEGR